MSEMNPALQQMLSQAENSAKQSSGNPMDLNSIPGSIAKGFGQTPGLDKPIGQGVGAQNLSEMNPTIMKSLTGIDPQALQALQTVDNSAKISGNVMTAPNLQHAALGTNKGGQGQGQ